MSDFSSQQSGTGQPGRNWLPENYVQFWPQRQRTHSVWLFSVLGGTRQHSGATYWLIQNSGLRQALYSARGAEVETSPQPGGVLYPEDAAVLRHQRSFRGLRLHVLLHCANIIPTFVKHEMWFHHELAKLVTDSKMYFEARNLSEECRILSWQTNKNRKNYLWDTKTILDFVLLCCFMIGAEWEIILSGSDQQSTAPSHRTSVIVRFHLCKNMKRENFVNIDN